MEDFLAGSWMTSMATASSFLFRFSSSSLSIDPTEDTLVSLVEPQDNLGELQRDERVVTDDFFAAMIEEFLSVHCLGGSQGSAVDIVPLTIQLSSGPLGIDGAGSLKHILESDSA